MSRRSEAYFHGIPMRPYDLIREGLIVFGVITILVIIFAAIFSSPDYPTVRGEDVAKRQPIAFTKTSVSFLSGDSGISTYGPPYTRDFDDAQKVLGIAPAKWFGVTIPLNPPVDFVIKPLERVSVFDKGVAAALKTYKAASPKQQLNWASAYFKVLDKATFVNGQVKVPNGNYGPVPTMAAGMLNLGRAGLLEGALQSDARLPYQLNFTKSLLFFQDDVDHSVANSLNLLGEQWGLSNETGNYPGAWWLWPYAFWYQIPAIASSPNGDLIVGLIMLAIFLVIFFVPFIPVLNGLLPRGLQVYKWVWRDWYHRGRPAVAERERKAG